MKKKFKLFATIASLCLAVALMAFGVYAASSVSFSASGSVSFQAAGVDGSWGVVAVVESGTFATAEGWVLSENNTKATKTGIVNDADETIPAVTVSNDGDNLSCVITITATFTNTSDRDATLKAETDASVTEGDHIAYTVGSDTGEATTTAGSGSVEVKVTFTAENDYTTYENEAYGFKFSATAA